MQIFDVGDVFAHCCDGFATPKLFVYPLCRLGGAFGVFEMFICRVGGANHFLSVGGCMSYLNKTCCGLVSRGIVMQLLGGIPLQSIGQQSTTIADGIGKVLMIYWRSMWEGQSSPLSDCGVKDAVFACYSMKRCIAFARIGRTTTYCSFECIVCLDLVLCLWYCYFWGGRIHLLRGREAIMQ